MLQDNSCMKTVCLFIYGWLPSVLFAQSISMQLEAGIKKLATDEQFKHAVISMYVADAKTGKIIFDKNSALGLAPASCQKIITSVTAFELLGSDFRYKTYISHDKTIVNGELKGNLYVTGAGDPTLGSARWKASSGEAVLNDITAVLQKNIILSIEGGIVVDDRIVELDAIPKGWVWEDIGNYYGAGAWGLNWRENLYDVRFKTGIAANDSTVIVATRPAEIATMYSFTNLIKTGAKGSGDNGYLFSAPFTKNIIARGSVPSSSNGFTIAGSMPEPAAVFLKELNTYLKIRGVLVKGNSKSWSESLMNNKLVDIPKTVLMDSVVSPSLDSVNYWFLKKSVNLFGEALVKTIAVKLNGKGSTEEGINIITNFWSRRGINPSAINIIDGSGLSPANRVTANSLVTILQFARLQKWYASFYKALPVINNISMKDGYINGVRTYAGYITSADGTGYTFCFMANNIAGNPGTAREKIWKLLDVLK